MTKRVVEWKYVQIGVFSWENNGLVIHNERCTSCGKCEKVCMVSAIRVAKNEEEYQKIQREIEEDPRNINDLLVDRYGAKPIDIAMIGREEEIEKKLEAKRPMLVELYNEDSLMCLLSSIPMKEIADAFDQETRYRKVEVKKQETLEKYQIEELPAMLLFKSGKLVGKIEGYYTNEQKDIFLEKIKKILKLEEE